MKKPLTLEQRSKLQAAMEGAFNDFNRLHMFTHSKLGLGNDFFPGATLPEKIAAIIAHFESQTRKQFVDFLRQLEAFTPNESLRGVIQGTIDNLPRMKFEHLEASDACQALFPGDRAYFNRHSVRLRFAELAAPNTTRTVAIMGPKGAGKTHSGQLVLHIEERVNPPFRHVWLDLLDDAGLGYNAGVFMRSIGRRMKFDITTIPPYEPQGQWINELRDWFLGELNSRNELWWLVIDGISQVDLGRDVRDLIRLLVKEIERSTTLLRLLLLGCADDEILSAGQRVRREILEPVDADDIRDFLVTAYQRRRVAVEQDGLDEMVRQITDALPQNATDRMRAIEERVAIAVDADWN